MKVTCAVAERLLHSQHVTSLLDAVRDAALMLGGKSCYFTRKNLAGLSNETGKQFYVVERIVHRVAGTVKCLVLCAHEAVESRARSGLCKYYFSGFFGGLREDVSDFL